MTDFLDLLETVRAEDASFQRMFGDAGASVRGLRRDDPRYQRSLSEAVNLYKGVISGRTPLHRLQEAMSTSDFPLLFGDIIDRQTLGSYLEWPTVWQRIAKRETVRDFRSVSRFFTDGAEAVLDEVPQGKEYPEAAISEGRYQYAVKKYGRRIPFLWEVFVNDDLDSLRDTPQRLAKAARVSEERFATDLYASATGPDGTFFAAGNTNIITANPVLSVASLQTGLTILSKQKDPDGNPIMYGQLRLVVPPALQVVAKNILNATEIRQAIGSGAASVDQITATNWMNGEFDLVVNPYLPIISTTNGDTSWYLFAEPTVGRPAVAVGFLRGHESPELFVKSPNAMRVGGGPVAAEDGDFDTDGINYKVRHVFGGTLMDPKSAVASNGTGV